MFSIDTVEQSREPITELQSGLYRVTVADVAFKKTKSGNGDYFEFTMQVVAPEGYNSKIWYRTNFNNINEKTVVIGRQQLADLMYCLKIKGFTHPDELRSKAIGVEFLAEVIVVVDGEKTRNEIEAVYSVIGTHRNPVRKLEQIKLGPNGKKPVVKVSANRPATMLVDNPANDFPF